MGSLANTMFRIMLSWLQGAVSAVWSVFTSEKGGSFLEWIGSNWIPIAAVLCLIGLTVDLGVYLVRWKPLRVWKSFFNRRKKTTDSMLADGNELQYDNFDFHNNIRTVNSRTEIPQNGMIPDLSKWEETPTEEMLVTEGSVDSLPPTVTGAGYIVPADSPYRRPRESYAPQQTEKLIDEKEKELKEDYRHVPIRPRKRRSLNVSELFSNPEEELFEFDAPQKVIDSKKAYHEPVYPRDWKKSEDKYP